MVRHKTGQKVEPEERDLGEYFAFAGDAGGEHVIEGGDAIGSDEQQMFADGVEVADFAAREQGKAGEIGLSECLQRDCCLG